MDHFGQPLVWNRKQAGASLLSTQRFSFLKIWQMNFLPASATCREKEGDAFSVPSAAALLFVGYQSVSWKPPLKLFEQTMNSKG